MIQFFFEFYPRLRNDIHRSEYKKPNLWGTLQNFRVYLLELEGNGIRERKRWWQVRTCKIRYCVSCLQADGVVKVIFHGEEGSAALAAAPHVSELVKDLISAPRLSENSLAVPMMNQSCIICKQGRVILTVFNLSLSTWCICMSSTTLTVAPVRTSPSKVKETLIAPLWQQRYEHFSVKSIEQTVKRCILIILPEVE